MINRNLGTMERVLRLIGAVVLFIWIASRASHDMLSAVAFVAASALTLNAVFSRCYLWTLLRINTCNRCQQQQCSIEKRPE